MPDRKKMLALVVHLPLDTKDRLGELLTRLKKTRNSKADCLSDVIIVAVDQMYDELMEPDNDE